MQSNLQRTEQEFAQIYARNVKRVYQISFLYLKNKADTEDAVQTVFYKYLKAQKEFCETEHEKAWFITAAQNTCRDLLRSFWRSHKVELEILQEIPYEEKHEEGVLLEKLLELPKKYKQVLYLYSYEQYSVQEISGLLHRNQSTIRAQLSKGRERLKLNLGGCYER